MIIDVMSFNLRCWTEGDGENSWPHRLSAVVSTITQYRPAILGTQEGQPRMLADLTGPYRDIRGSGLAETAMAAVNTMQSITGLTNLRSWNTVSSGCLRIPRHPAAGLGTVLCRASAAGEC